ncbi:MAG: 1-phosphofructokinase [Candidatus Krumholzibacteriia bacterium]
MIYTVTLNPALDRAITVDSLLPDDTVRVKTETDYAAGKGIDVSRVIKELGGHSVALGLVGGYDGLRLEGLLLNAGVVSDFTRIAGETRTNILLREESADRQFVISASGPDVSAAELGALFQKIRGLGDAGYLILSGSLPRGVTPEIYGQLILAGRALGAVTVVDADGAALKEAVAHAPCCIKPNIHELERLVDRTLETEAEILAAGRDLLDRGLEQVLVSRGRQGLLLCARDGALKARGPEIEAQSTVGAGDSAVAGFVLARARGLDLGECLRWSCAAGVATAMTPGTELCHWEDVERILPQIEVTEL